MKKQTILTLFISICCLFIFTSCGNVSTDFSNTYNSETDSQFSYIPQGSPPSIAEAKDGYYFLAGYYLYYVDKKDRKPIILCNKPNCLHNNETNAEKTINCNAVFPSQRTFIIYNNSHLYIVNMNVYEAEHNYYLSEISLDGTKRKTLVKLGKIMPNSLVIHRGNVYYTSTYYDEKGKSVYGIQKISLDKLNSKPEEIYKGVLKVGNIQDINCYGNNLYFTEYCHNDEIVTTRLMRIDLKTGSASRLNDDSKDGASAPIICNNKLLTSAYNVDKTGMVIDFESFIADLDGANKTKSFLTSNNTIQVSDNKYLYSYTAWWLMKQGEENVMIIYDKEGNILDRMSMAIGGKVDTVISGGEKDLFITNYTDTMYQIYTVDKATIGSGKMKPVLLFEIDKEKLTCQFLTKTQ